MSRQRLCRRCGAKLAIDDDRCAACGEHNPAPVAWYAPLLGLAVVLLLIWLLVDFADVAELLGL